MWRIICFQVEKYDPVQYFCFTYLTLAAFDAKISTRTSKITKLISKASYVQISLAIDVSLPIVAQPTGPSSTLSEGFKFNFIDLTVPHYLCLGRGLVAARSNKKTAYTLHI